MQGIHPILVKLQILVAKKFQNSSQRLLRSYKTIAMFRCKPQYIDLAAFSISSCHLLTSSFLIVWFKNTTN